MEIRLLIALIVLAVAGVTALVIDRRRPDPPSRGGAPIPDQLDRTDFVRPDAPWLVVTFTSRTCASCQGLFQMLTALESDQVAVEEAEFPARRALHQRYAIDAVPLTLVVDEEGRVRRSFVGRMTATDLWAAVAEAREEGAPSRSGLDAPTD